MSFVKVTRGAAAGACPDTSPGENVTAAATPASVSTIDRTTPTGNVFVVMPDTIGVRPGLRNGEIGRNRLLLREGAPVAVRAAAVRRGLLEGQLRWAGEGHRELPR